MPSGITYITHRAQIQLMDIDQSGVYCINAETTVDAFKNTPRLCRLLFLSKELHCRCPLAGFKKTRLNTVLALCLKRDSYSKLNWHVMNASYTVLFTLCAQFNCYKNNPLTGAHSDQSVAAPSSQHGDHCQQSFCTESACSACRVCSFWVSSHSSKSKGSLWVYTQVWMCVNMSTCGKLSRM